MNPICWMEGMRKDELDATKFIRMMKKKRRKKGEERRNKDTYEGWVGDELWMIRRG